MSKFTKLLLGLGITVVALVIAAVALFWVLALWPDAPPPADSTMLPKWKEHSGSGPLADFQIWLRTHPISTADPLYARLVKKETWNAKDAEVFLQKHHEILEHFNTLLNSDPTTWSVLDASKVTLANPFGSTEQLTSPGILKKIQMRSLAEKGQFNDAAAEAKKLIRMGQGLQAAEGTLIHRLIGFTYLVIGIDGFSMIAEKGGGSAQDWAEWQAFLASAEPKEDDLQRTCQVEYLAFKRMIEALKQGTIDPQSVLPKDAPSKASLLKPNATCQIYLDLLQPILTAHQQNQGWAPVERAANDLYDKLGEMKSGWIKIFVSSNAMGKAMTFITVPTYKPIFLKEYTFHAKVRETVCNIALHRYELDEGKLPDQLSQLVPKYLPAVPLDPFDLKPMKWNPKTRVIYSVGPNMQDDGGQFDEKSYSKGKDIGAYYWWRSASK